MNVRPAGREPCACSSPINQILERLDQMDADIQAAQQAANTAVGTANSQAGVAAASAASAAQDASDALGHAAAAQQSADDALLEATNAAGSAQDAADDLADALLAIQNIESTIASVLATDIGAKVDKLTTAGFHLYTHNGSTQGEVAPDINPTAATIPIRDSNGKLFGADPASGATDKTLVTANWVSQTGDSAPNNLIHRSGSETKDGQLNLPGCYYGIRRYYIVNNDNTADNVWRKAFEITMANGRDLEIEVSCHFNNTDVQNARVKIVRTSSTTVACIVLHSEGSTAAMSSAANYVATLDNGIVSFYVYKRRRFTNLLITTDIFTNYGGYAQLPAITYTNTASNDPTTETHDHISVGTIVPYRNGA